MSIQIIEGKVVAQQSMNVEIVASRFNSFIVQKLLDGAVCVMEWKRKSNGTIYGPRGYNCYL